MTRARAHAGGAGRLSRAIEPLLAPKAPREWTLAQYANGRYLAPSPVVMAILHVYPDLLDFFVELVSGDRPLRERVAELEARSAVQQEALNHLLELQGIPPVTYPEAAGGR